MDGKKEKKRTANRMNSVFKIASWHARPTDGTHCALRTVQEAFIQDCVSKTAIATRAERRTRMILRKGVWGQLPHKGKLEPHKGKGNLRCKEAL